MSLEIDYEQVLRTYLAEKREVDLMRAYELGKEFQHRHISPDEIIGVHLGALDAVTSSMTEEERLKEVLASFSVLIEMMIAYGMAYGEAYQLLERTAREAEEAKFELERTIVDLDLANEQLQEITRLKDQFFANMSHELRTPLNAIIGFAEDALDGLAGELNPKQQRYVSNILSAGRHLLSVINEILDLAKLQSGKASLDLAPVALHEVVADLEDTLHPLVLRKKQTLETVEMRSLPPVRADRAKLYQILLNLASNAHKYTPEGGRITVSAVREGECVRVSVADTGVGIPPQALPHLFEEFRQIDGLRARREQSTGLGLAITKRLVELHGGTITVESVVDQGSTFTFTLPVAPEAI